MNNLLESNLLNVLITENNITYILKNKSLFNATNYMVQQNCEDSCFVKCMRIYFNGEHQFYYITNKYRAFDGFLSQAEENVMFTLIRNLFESIKDVKENGFLKLINIDITPNHIFVDPTTYKVYLIYVPVTVAFFDNEAEFENEFRSTLIKFLLSNKHRNSIKINALINKLQDSLIELDSILDFKQKGVSNKQKVLKLVSLDPLYPLSIPISKLEFIIGRSKKADGVVDKDQRIGRQHCKIKKDQNEFYVIDLDSKNGTFVNLRKIEAYTPIKLSDSDHLKISTVEFKVLIEEIGGLDE